jgi:hypothetical protein
MVCIFVNIFHLATYTLYVCNICPITVFLFVRKSISFFSLQTPYEGNEIGGSFLIEFNWIYLFSVNPSKG